MGILLLYSEKIYPVFLVRNDWMDDKGNWIIFISKNRMKDRIHLY